LRLKTESKSFQSLTLSFYKLEVYSSLTIE
jgi:hypothetical protein